MLKVLLFFNKVFPWQKYKRNNNNKNNNNSEGYSQLEDQQVAPPT